MWLVLACASADEAGGNLRAHRLCCAALLRRSCPRAGVLAFDDSDLLGAFALNPRATWLLPLGASDEESEEGHYFDFRIEPGFSIGKGGRVPLPVLLPMAVGFDDSHHYGR